MWKNPLEALKLIGNLTLVYHGVETASSEPLEAVPIRQRSQGATRLPPADPASGTRAMPPRSPLPSCANQRWPVTVVGGGWRRRARVGLSRPLPMAPAFSPPSRPLHFIEERVVLGGLEGVAA